MSRRTELEKGAAGEQTATDQRGINSKEDAVKNDAEQKSLGILHSILDANGKTRLRKQD
jgi:hypothetical protein